MNTRMLAPKASPLLQSRTTLSRMLGGKAYPFDDGLDTPSVLTVERLRTVLDYDLDTGVFTWLVPMNERLPVGSVAGCRHKNDRVYIGLDHKLHQAHRLAWFYVYGEWPARGLDHRDTIPYHNWIDNLRLATQAQNNQNRRRPSAGNQCGFLGVSPARGRFQAHIRFQGGEKWLGYYDTPEEAHAVYVAAKRELHPFGTL
jgi:hypothetical protein